MPVCHGLHKTKSKSPCGGRWVLCRFSEAILEKSLLVNIPDSGTERSYFKNNGPVITFLLMLLNVSYTLDQ